MAESQSKDNEDFLNKFYSLLNKFDKKELKKKALIKQVYLIRAAEFLVIAKPQSHTKNHKANLLKYLELLQFNLNSNNNNEKDYRSLKTSLLYPLKQWMHKYGYRSTFELIYFRIISGLILDSILWLIFYADFYFMPIITLVYFLLGIFKYWKVKKANKLLNLI